MSSLGEAVGSAGDEAEVRLGSLRWRAREELRTWATAADAKGPWKLTIVPLAPTRQ